MSRFNPDTSDYITKAVFDDALSTSEIRILIVLFSSSRGYLFSSRKIGEFIGKSHTTTYRAIKKLLQLEYLIDTNGNYSLNTGRIGCFKNETGVSNMKQEGVSNMKRKCFKNETTIYINNNIKKNNKKEEEKPPNPLKGEFILCANLNTELGRNSFSEWLHHKKEIGKAYKPIGLQKLITQLGNTYKTDRELKAAIDHSISNNYQGIYAPKKNHTQKNKYDESIDEINNMIKHFEGQ